MRVATYWFLAFPGADKFLGSFHMQEGGYHRIDLVDDEHDALMFTEQEAIDNLGMMLTSMGYTVAPGSLTAQLQ